MSLSEMKEMIKKVNGKIALGETTPVKLGLVLVLLGFVFTSAWWSATIISKLDVVVGDVRGIRDEQKSMKSDVDALKLWKAEIDRSGSRALDDLRKEVYALRMEFQVHAHMNGAKP